MARKTQISIVTMPGRRFLVRASRTMLFGAGLILLVMSKADNPAAVNLRTTILDTVTPVIAVAARPFDAVSDVADWMGTLVDMHAENILLKNQNMQLLQWQAMAKRMEAENQSLKKLLNVVPAQKYAYITAHMVSDSGGPFAQSALIDGGKEQGIKADQPVINENGLIGRVVDAGKTSARVLLLDDINSRVPVMAERGHDKGILTGSNGTLPTLSYLSSNNSIEVGDRIITSGDGGVFPPGIPVGVVASKSGSNITVQPFSGLSHIEYVSVIDASF